MLKVVEYMKYSYHFEFCERPELPSFLRAQFFDSLSWVQNHFGLKSFLTGPVTTLLKNQDYDRVIELGSGSGENLEILESQVQGIQWVATDKYSHSSKNTRSPSNGVEIERVQESITFDNFSEKLPVHPKTAILLISTFHHMRNDVALRFFEQAQEMGADVIIVEPLRRHLFHLVLGSLSGVASVMAPFARLFKQEMKASAFFSALLTHIFFPITPLLLSHDGIVSAFRQRTLKEIAIISGSDFDASEIANLGSFFNPFWGVHLRMGSKRNQ